MSPYHLGLEEGNHPRPSTSRGTQRLYIRLNTLHYIASQLSSLEKCLSHSSKIVPSQRNRFASSSSSHHSFNANFENTRSCIMAATQRVSEVAAYRLIFLDSNSVLYGSLYVGDVVNARISPALRVLKQNLTLLSAIVTERAQPLAIKEVMRASFEAFLMVLIAGGGSRSFTRADHEMIEDDLKHLKRVFACYGEGVIPEEVVEKEAETVEGVVALMEKSTEQLVDDFTVVACEGSSMGISSGKTLPMPPTTGRWSSSDPNTMLRVLCHRKDRVANLFLKRTFHLAKRG